MAPTVLLECTKERGLKRKVQDLSFVVMAESQKLSKGFSSGCAPDYQHDMERTGESEGFGSSGRVDSVDSSAPKRKCISLNIDYCNDFNVPKQVFPVSKMSYSERKQLGVKLRTELERVHTIQKKILSRGGANANGIAPPSFSSSLKKNRDPVGQNVSNIKRGVAGRFESGKKAPASPSVRNSYAMLMKQCDALLKRLMSHQYAWVFNTPVDVVKLKIPDYFTVIKQPMDLGTIKTKITSGAYSNPWGFVADVRLTFTNALTYNPPGNDVHVMADTMSKFFETRWKPIEKKLAAVDASVKREVEEPGPTPQKMKTSLSNSIAVPEIAKPGMTDEEKHSISRQLESLLGDIPKHIIDILRRHSCNTNEMSEDEIEIDIDSLSDKTLIYLKKLLDDYLQQKKTERMTIPRPCDVEFLNGSGISNLSMHPSKGNEPLDEDVDIGGSDPPDSTYPSVEIEKDATLKSGKCGISSISSTDSDSSSDSDSGSSSGSESDIQIASPTEIARGNAELGPAMDQEKSEVMNSLDVNISVGSLNHSEQDSSRHRSIVVDGHKEGENAPPERQVSPEKLYRAALLRSRFADTILKAREKTLNQSEKGDREKLRCEREELERQQREERARLQAEAKAVEDARKRAQAEAAAEAKRKRELEREAARQALMKMEKTVEINENTLLLKDLEMLQSVPAEHVNSSVDETSPDPSPDGCMGGFKFGGCNPLEQLGLYMRVDDEEEEEGEPSKIPTNDVEEGEID